MAQGIAWKAFVLFFFVTIMFGICQWGERLRTYLTVNNSISTTEILKFSNSVSSLLFLTFKPLTFGGKIFKNTFTSIREKQETIKFLK